MRFKNKVVVIASSGTNIGITCAKRYLNEGAKVVLYTNEIAYNSISGEFQSLYKDSFHTILVNFHNKKELIKAAEYVIGQFGTVDIIVVAITIEAKGTIEKTKEYECLKIIHTILTGTLWTIQPLIPTMMENKYGRIVVVSSLAGRTNIKGANTMYAAANAGLGGMVRNIACTMGLYYITANLVAIGPLDDGSYFPSEDGSNEGILLNKGKGSLNDVAGAVEYFSADLASWITGETLDLNGGYFMV